MESHGHHEPKQIFLSLSCHSDEERDCGSLNVIDPHKLIGRCGLGEEGVALVKEVRHCGLALRSLLLKLYSM